MIKLENYEVLGWEHAIRGMRNPMNSWHLSDSKTINAVMKAHELIPGVESYGYEPCEPYFAVGEKDHELMMNLRNAGTDHRKYMRMIAVYVDITAPLYWWKEFDTYKVGTVANSCSTMHKIADKEFTLDDFSCEHLLDSYLGEDRVANMDVCDGDWTPMNVLDFIKDTLNHYRKLYLETKNTPTKNLEARKELMKKYWWQMIQLLPSSYNQKRTVMLNYEVLANMYKSRKTHKLDEWVEFCKWIETLPYSEIITGDKKNVD